MGKTKIKKWTNEELSRAVEVVKNKQMSLRKASRQFGIPRSTLQLKVNGWKGREPNLHSQKLLGRKLVIPFAEEKKLADCLKIMSKWGFGLGKIEVLNVVQDYVIKNEISNPFTENRPGNKWFNSFTKRHQLSLKKPEIVEGSRARQANDPFIVKKFHELLLTTVKELNLESKPESVHNCDESGFKNDPTSSKIVTQKGVPAKRVTGGNARKTTTVLACVNAAGQKQPPLILHKGKRIWDSMMGEAAYPGTSYAVSENGWMTERIFANWFRTQFLPKVSSKPALLLYDGHLSHVSLDLINTAIEAQVTILKLPPHTSHILQPLDVCVFKGVKSTWDKMLAEWARHNYGKNLSKDTFANILGKVWTNVTSETIKKGFEKTGIFPVNEKRIPDSIFDPEKLKRYKEMYPTALDNSTPSIEVALAIPGQENIQVQTQSSSIQVQNSPSKTFENILLKTVSPAIQGSNTRKKVRINDAEIITSESYLQNLQIITEKKKIELEKKVQAKKDKENGLKRKLKDSKVSKPAKKPKKDLPTEKFPKKKGQKRCVF